MAKSKTSNNENEEKIKNLCIACQGLAITLAQIILDEILNSNEAMIFSTSRYGASLSACREASNLLNSVCIEHADIQGNKLILMARNPQPLLKTNEDGKTELWDELSKRVKEVQGLTLAIGVFDERFKMTSTGVWGLFNINGFMLDDLDSDKPTVRDQAKEWFNTYFGTFIDDEGLPI